MPPPGAGHFLGTLEQLLENSDEIPWWEYFGPGDSLLLPRR